MVKKTVNEAEVLDAEAQNDSGTPIGGTGGEVIEQRRPWTNDAHVATQDTPQLRNLIEAGLAQEAANRRQELIRIGQQMRCHDRCINAHGAQFRHGEQMIIAADPVRPVQGRPF